MIDRLESITRRYNELNEELMLPTTLSNINKTRELSKEMSLLEDIVICYQKYKRILTGIDESKEMMHDPELGEMAHEEHISLLEEKTRVEQELEILLIPKDPNDGKNVIIEIRGAAGGDEANIFAGDLYRMYQKYAESENWSVEVLDEMEGSSGGFSQIEFMIKGKKVYSRLKYESGSHRVQRVPATESQGRIQTSTATVLVMPEAEEVDIEVKEGDIKIDVYRSSGAGGQHVNTTDSAVRMTHLPTGIVVTCQNQRSQIQNREKALQMLKTKLYEQRLREADEKEGSVRRSKIGTGDRAEKIRTYNYPQNRVTDHRIGFTTKQLDRVMDGDMAEIIDALINEDQKRKLAGI
ncbi:MAG: peptide chain release factor 1 [Bacilli bacterium]